MDTDAVQKAKGATPAAVALGDGANQNAIFDQPCWTDQSFPKERNVSSVVRIRIGVGSDPKLLLDTLSRQAESLYVEVRTT